ncbi:DUF5719 family protein [Aeromicrobium sp. CF3.5]|uniref:DUF5719 family protein n=1 Tax=Aeromicrobium sp. CF3.5 TaxID=3373078 RepID=UPI003EE4C052
MTRSLLTRAWPALLPGAAAVMVLVASLVPGRSDDPAPAQSVDVVETSYACPAGRGTTVGAGQVRAGDDRSVRVFPEDADAEAATAMSDPGAWTTSEFDAEGVVVTETGQGAAASGHFGRVAPDDQGGGLAVGRCPGVADDAWFLGAGSGGRHFSTLVLSNLSSAPAVADVELWGTEGPIDAVEASGITLDAYEVRRLPLQDLAAGESVLGLEVQRTRGALSATVLDRFTAAPAGSETIGSAQAPRRDQIIGGVDGGAEDKELMLLNPGDQTARVDIESLGADGTFPVEDLQDLVVEPGAYVEVDVPDSVGSGPQAFRVVGDQPVAAGLRVRANDTDYAVSETTPALDGSAVVPVDLGSGVTAPQLLLTAPDRAASVDVEVFDAQMTSLGSSSVDVDAGTTQSVRAVPEGTSDAAYVVVRGTGDVVAAASYSGGDRISSLAVVPTPVSVAAPAVRPADG